MDWDDARIFLALVRAGSVRAAAANIGISHSTVARRVEAFETRLGVKLLDRTNHGYVLTAAGEDLLAVVENIENEFDGVQRRIVGQDRRLAGVIRVTTIDTLATHLLMPDFVRFGKLYPDTSLELLVTYESLDLGRREADVALRFVNKPPTHLIGRKLATIFIAAYASPDYIDKTDLDDPTSASWIGFGTAEPFPKWIKQSDYPHLPAKGVFDSMLTQMEAARCGMGIASLPCYIGDPDPYLRRLPATKPQPAYDMWLLRHRDTRSTARLRVFSEFIVDAVAAHQSLLEGTVA